MISVTIIEEHLDKLGLGDFNISETTNDGRGDFIKAILPELDFNLIKTYMIKSKYYNKALKDASPNRLDFEISDIYDGMNFVYNLVVEVGNPVGVVIKALTKRLEYFDDGEYKPLLGFGMLKDVKDTYSN